MLVPPHLIASLLAFLSYVIIISVYINIKLAFYIRPINNYVYRVTRPVILSSPTPEFKITL